MHKINAERKFEVFPAHVRRHIGERAGSEREVQLHLSLIWALLGMSAQLQVSIAQTPPLP
jgi:hypothetical protein